MTASTKSRTASLVGTWTATSAIDGVPAPYSTTFVFREDHTMEAIGPAGPDGKPAFGGPGHWIPRPDGSFVYHVTHPLPDPEGGAPGTIHSIQQVTVSGDTHASSGTAVLHGPDGAVVGSFDVTLTAVR
ncbi:hypothetical protein [Streptomyces sp. DH37]|uniref:hypothetical protein n=1 Tax=Streptomyces sp. DH37 TaxID=3040122 RepID=UPI002441AF71|nr:hypothetical protein [Streptomyces sp. DH37]MDG9704717.1 hypothetical protein [Streptomyces sp. DH37]